MKHRNPDVKHESRFLILIADTPICRGLRFPVHVPEPQGADDRYRPQPNGD